MDSDSQDTSNNNPVDQSAASSSTDSSAASSSVVDNSSAATGSPVGVENVASAAVVPNIASITTAMSQSAAAQLCPDNSNDCLLRALLDLQVARDVAKSQEVNWDPINVALTAVIGALALIIAILAIFQGLLAAGPGRLKASQTAIGRYSRFSRTHFSWFEMRVRSTAYTPMIDSYALFRLKSKPVRESPTSDASFADYSEKDVSVSNEKRRLRMREPQPPAGWLILLEYIHLADYEGFSKVACHTDYLPQDLYAPPAYADVFAITVLALVSGCNSLQMDGNYPRVQGSRSQLYFRDHPQLGDVAVYEHFPGRMDGAESWHECDTYAALRYASGELLWDDDLLVTDRFFRLNGNYSGMHDIHLLPIFKKMRRMLPGIMELEDSVYSTALGVLPCLSGLLLCSVHVRDAVAFGVGIQEPKKVLRQLGEAMGILPRERGCDAFICEIEEEFKFHGFDPIDDPYYALVPADKGPWLTQANAALSFDYEGCYDTIYQLDSHGRKLKTPVVFRHNLIKSLLDWLDSPDPWVDPAVYSQHSGGLMIDALNKILGFYGTPYAVAGFWDLLSEPSLRDNNTRTQHHTIKEVKSMDQLKGPRPETVSMKFIKHVLWLRAVCLVAFLASLPDTSPLVDTELGQRILPVL
ncbi:hypothetical protein H072_6830 [Dactylellina haptotyla CBS 200.50]|uniref:Uncharacterized protein n=1 Tax=Dactylellina haptotyla (strain CBS 200.50) TaxID=1284197 RepID=S8A976_DACHA|nr:hypothetical protein H072_6830 [Dactylellina haptotyla CBS 200.50]